MRTAFIVLKSPHEQDPKEFIRAFSARGDASLILFEDGVLHALAQEARSGIGEVVSEILVCEEDLSARGFSPSDLKVGKVVGYSEIVDCIMERTERTITV